jgi:hypothetical protein
MGEKTLYGFCTDSASTGRREAVFNVPSRRDFPRKIPDLLRSTPGPLTTISKPASRAERKQERSQGVVGGPERAVRELYDASRPSRPMDATLS